MFLKDLLFPKFCLGCGFLGAYICLNCQKKLSYIEKDVCLYCGRASLYGFTHPGCKRQFGVDGFLSIFHYNDLLKKIIKNIKYRLATDVWKELCLIVEPERLSKFRAFKKILNKTHFLEPIPLHPHKLRSRGFNQAKIIAEFFYQFLQFQLTEYLVRKKDTLSQAQIPGHKQRYENMRGAFAVKSEKEVKGKKFILVDDVLTTGSTIKEAARSLKLSRAKSVFVVTIAKG